MSNLIPGVAATKAAKKVVKKLPKKKKMRQPTAKELKEGRIAGKAFGGQRALTPGDKKGEMIYSRPSYGTEGTRGKRVQVKSGVKGGRGTPPPRVKPTPSKAQIHSAQMKEKLTEAVNEANNRSAKANRSTIRKNETIGQQRKRKAENEAIDKGFKTIALNSGGSIEDGLQGNNKIPTIKPKPGPHKVRPPGYQPPKVKKITKPKSEFEGYMEKTQPKKYGGKINYRMGGGQVVDSSYD